MSEHKGALFIGGRGGHREVNVLNGRDLGKSFLGRVSRSAHLDEGVTRCVCCAPELCTCRQMVSPGSSAFTLFALSKDPELVFSVLCVNILFPSLDLNSLKEGTMSHLPLCLQNWTFMLFMEGGILFY